MTGFRLVVSLGFLLGFLWSGEATAKIELVVSTTRAEHQIAPGGSETGVVEVTNEDKQPLRVRVYLEDWSLNPQGEVVFSRAGSTPHSLANWVQANPTDFRLDPGQKRQVRYTLTVPAATRPQSYWAALNIEASPVLTAQTSPRAMTVRGRIAVMLYQKTGNPPIQARLQDFQAEGKKKAAAFTLVLANSGQGHYRVKGHIGIKNSRGEEVSKLELSDFPVLPGSTRTMQIERPLNLPLGKYEAVLVVDVGQRELLGSKKSFTIP